MPKPHILIVEDEEHLAVGIQFNLLREGYHASIAMDGRTALSRIQTEPIDLVILDLMLPRMSGYDVCQAIRESGRDIPILILSARTLAEDRIRGFDVGANQYLTKPFDLDELISRVRNLLTYSRGRRSDARPAGDTAHFTFDEASINFDTFEVIVRGALVKLTSLEMRLLKYFIQHRGRVIPRQEILENVWQVRGQLSTRSVDQFIMRLRKIFEIDPTNPRYFLTVRDAGYRFDEQGEG